MVVLFLLLVIGVRSRPIGVVAQLEVWKKAHKMSAQQFEIMIRAETRTLTAFLASLRRRSLRLRSSSTSSGASSSFAAKAADDIFLGPRPRPCLGSSTSMLSLGVSGVLPELLSPVVRPDAELDEGLPADRGWAWKAGRGGNWVLVVGEGMDVVEADRALCMPGRVVGTLEALYTDARLGRVAGPRSSANDVRRRIDLGAGSSLAGAIDEADEDEDELARVERDTVEVCRGAGAGAVGLVVGADEGRCI